MASEERRPALSGLRGWTWQRAARVALVLIALYAVYWLLWGAWNALVPFMVGLILAYLLHPLVELFSQQMPRWLAILVVYAIGIAVVIAIVLLIVPPAIRQVEQLATQVPKWYSQNVAPEARQWLGWYRQNIPPSVQVTVNEQIVKIQNTLKANATEYISDVTSGVLSAVTGVFRTVIFLLGFLIVPFWLFYVLKDHEQGSAALNRLLPEQLRPDFWAIVQIFDRIFSSYIRGQIILGAIVAVASFVGLSLLKLFGINVNYILLLSLIAGVTELIPVIGPLLGAIPAVIVGLASAGTSGGLGVLLVYIIVQQIENNVLVPRIIGGVVEIHPAMLMVLLVMAGAIWGLPGVILVAPVAAVARDVFRYIYQRLRDIDPSTAVGRQPLERQEVVEPQAGQVGVAD